MICRVLFFVLLNAFFIQANAQNKLQQYIKEANDDIAQKKYEQARVSVQMALNELNYIMGKQLLAAIPVELGGMKADTADDVNGNGPDAMASGLSVSREYEGANDKNATLSVMTNSSASASINMVLNNPTMIDQEDGGEKIVTINSFKGLLSWDDEEKTGDIQIPIGNSVISLDTDGFSSSEAVVSFVSKLDIAGIKKRWVSNSILMNKILFLFIVAGTITSCKFKNPEGKPDADKTGVVYGKPFNYSVPLSATNLVLKIGNKARWDTVVMGSIITISNNNNWLKLNAGNGSNIFVDWDNKFSVGTDVTGKTAIVDGYAYVDTFSVADLKKYAKEEGKPGSDIDSITHPVVQLAFKAKAMVIY